MKIIYIASSQSIHSLRWIKFFTLKNKIIWITNSEPNKENLREFTDEVMKEIKLLSEECEDYWESRKILPRMKNYIKDKLR